MTPAEIISLRHRLGLTQEQLAHQMGVSYTTVNRWENGHAKPHRVFVKELRRLAEESSGTPVAQAPVSK